MIYRTALLSLLFVLFAGLESIAQSHTLRVNIEGVVSEKGELRISLFDSESAFLESSYRQHRVDLTEENQNSFTFENLPRGNYAIAVMQDTNGNGELDSGVMGPKEPYGFSNDARGWFGPPSYDKVKFPLLEDQSMTINIK